MNLCLCFFGAKIGGRGFWCLVVRFTKETFEDDDYLYLGPTKWDSCWLTDGFLRKQRSRACCETWDEKPLNLSFDNSKHHPDGVRYLVLEYCSGGDVLDRIISDGVMDEMSYLCRNKKPMGSKRYLSKLT